MKPTTTPSGPSRALRAPIRLYQHIRAGRPSTCRYWPSCSQYALEALEVHGAWRGSGLAVRRIGRCHPWGGHGVDPVPPAVMSPAVMNPAVMSTDGGRP